MISFTQFKYFLVVAHEKSFTKASKILYISQQALSNHINSMEKELNVKLFERTTPLKLTYAGSVFQKYADQFCLLQKEMYQELQDIHDKQRGVYHLGISINRGPLILPQLLPTLRKEFPNVEFYITESNYEDLKENLLNGSLDLIIEQMPFEDEEIESVTLCTDDLCMLVSDGFLAERFGDQADAVKEQLYSTGTLSTLAGCPFLLNKVGNSIRSKIEEILSLEGIEPECSIETENMTTLLNLCANNYGITFYPKLFLLPPNGTLVPSNVNVIPLRYPSSHYALGIAYKKGQYLSNISKRIISLIQDPSSLNELS